MSLFFQVSRRECAYEGRERDSLRAPFPAIMASAEVPPSSVGTDDGRKRPFSTIWGEFMSNRDRGLSGILEFLQDLPPPDQRKYLMAHKADLPQLATTIAAKLDIEFSRIAQSTASVNTPDIDSVLKPFAPHLRTIYAIMEVDAGPDFAVVDDKIAPPAGTYVCLDALAERHLPTTLLALLRDWALFITEVHDTLALLLDIFFGLTRTPLTVRDLVTSSILQYMADVIRAGLKQKTSPFVQRYVAHCFDFGLLTPTFPSVPLPFLRH